MLQHDRPGQILCFDTAEVDAIAMQLLPQLTASPE